MKRSLALLLPLALVACQDSQQPFSPTGEDAAAQLAQAATADVIPGRFIITVREGVSPASVARDHGVSPDYVYTHALNGFAGAMSEAARSGLLRDARVLRVEPDGIARITTTQSMDSKGDPWGLDRIDAQTTNKLNGSYTYSNTGSGVNAYIIDTGIKVDHADFGSRAVYGYDSVDGTNVDCNGHGTHVAGTVGGTIYGVAKGVSLIAVRVLNCDGSGTWSGVIAGMDWVTANHVKPAVANMSLGGGQNSSVDEAARRMIAAGVATAIAAGNGNMVGIHQDACKSSPARVAEAMTISATDKTDKKASWANYGSCVDWFAPGVGIKSAWHNTDYGADFTRSISGTSMATPHVAGVAALHLQRNPGHSPQQVRDALYALTTRGVVTSSRTANNHLLYTNY